MIINCKISLEDEDFDKLAESEDMEIIFNLENVKYIASKEISKILMLFTKGKKIKVINANEHIIETFNILQIREAVGLE